MRFQRPGGNWLLRHALVAAYLILSVPASAAGNVLIEKITYITEKGGTRVRIYGSDKFEYTDYKLPEPARIAVEIPNASTKFKPGKRSLDEGSVASIYTESFPELGSVRVEIEIIGDAPAELEYKSGYLEIFVPNPAEIHLNSMRSYNEGSEGTIKLDISAEPAQPPANEPPKPGPSIVPDERPREEMSTASADTADSRSIRAQKELEEFQSREKVLRARIAFMEERLKKSQPGTPPGKAKRVRIESLAGPDGSGGAEIDTSENIGRFVDDWGDAWRDEDLERYASHYSEHFRYGEKNRDEWLNWKKTIFAREGKPSIDIGEPEITQISENFARVTFTQRYSSENLTSAGSKTLTLTKESGQWKILHEEWNGPGR